MIDFEFLDIEIPGFDSEFFVSSIKSLIVSEELEAGAVVIILCNDDYLLELNKKHLNHDYYTDIITFDYSEKQVVSGDLFISYDRVLENANVFNVDVNYELSRVVYHGILHLCGFKDKTEEDQIIMRQKENYYLDEFVSRETN